MIGGILSWVKDKALSSRQFMAGLFVGFFICLIFLYIFINFFIGVKREEVFFFLTNKDRIYCYSIFEKYLQSISENFTQLEKISLNRQRKLWKYIEEKLPEDNNKIEAEILDITNRDRDILRAYLEYNNFVLSYIRNKMYTEKSQEILNNLSQAYYLMHLDNYKSYEEASSILKETFDKSDEYDYIKLEIIRNLTFCNFALLKKDYAEFWMNQALKIRLSKDISLSEYIRRFFWIDLNDFYLCIEKNKLKSAEEAFERLTDSSDPEFLRIKLKQHKRRISPEKQEIWQRFIDRLN